MTYRTRILAWAPSIGVASATWLVGCATTQGSSTVSGEPGAHSSSGSSSGSQGAVNQTAPSASTSAPAGEGGSGESGATPPDVDAGAMGTSPPSSFDFAKTFAGTYAGVIKFRKVITLGNSIGTFNALANLYTRLELVADESKMTVTLNATECHVDLSGTGTGGLAGATLQVPDVVTTTTHPDPMVFSAATSGGSMTWKLSEFHAPIGWKWASPSDMTPTTSSDSRIFDQDMDGNPGVTMHVLWQGTDTPLYYVQTQRDLLSGTVDASGNLVGTTVDNTEQNIIGNTSALGGYSVSWMADSNTADNKVSIVHITSTMTCQDVVSQSSTLFK